MFWHFALDLSCCRCHKPLSVDLQLCLVLCDVLSGFFALLTLICHLADFTNTFRSLASVQPEDSSDDLPGPLQEVGPAYSCLSHAL